MQVPAWRGDRTKLRSLWSHVQYTCGLLLLATGQWLVRRATRRTVLGIAGEDLHPGELLRFGADGKLYRGGTEEQN